MMMKLLKRKVVNKPESEPARGRETMAGFNASVRPILSSAGVSMCRDSGPTGKLLFHHSESTRYGLPPLVWRWPIQTVLTDVLTDGVSVWPRNTDKT